MPSLHSQLQDMRESGKLASVQVPNMRPEFKLRDYQVEAALFTLLSHPNSLLNLSTGLGKTFCSLAAFAIARNKNPGLKLLVLSESSTLYQWEEEAHALLEGITTQVVVTPPQNKRKGWPSPVSARRYYYQMTDADIVIVSHAIFREDWENESIRELVAKSRIIFDEATAAKNPKSGLYKAMEQAGPTTRLGSSLLTATPIFKCLMDYYNLLGLVNKLSRGKLKDFHEKYCIRKPDWVRKRRFSKYTPMKVVGYKDEAKFHAQVQDNVFYRTAKDVGEALPAVIEKPVLLSMKEDQRRIYEAAKAGKYNVLDEGLVDIEDETRERNHAETLAAVSQMRERAVSNDPALVGEKNVSSVKMEKLVQLLCGPMADMKVLIYSQSRKCIDYYQKEVAKAVKKQTKRVLKSVRVTGKESAKKRAKSKEEFWKPDGPNVCYITDAAQKGVNLQCAEAIIFLDQPWAPGARSQLIGRICRIGSLHAKVLCLVLVVKGTVDEKVHKILKVRSNVIENTFGAQGLMVPSPLALQTVFDLMDRGATAEQALIRFAEQHSKEFECFMKSEKAS